MKLQKIVLAALFILPVYESSAMEQKAEIDRSESHLSAALKEFGYEKWAEIHDNVDITDSNGDTPLLFIARNFMATRYLAESLTMLNAQGANLNFVNKKNGLTPLLAALSSSGKRGVPDQTLAVLLVKMGADVNRSSRNGLTPLILAASYNFNDLVKVLLQPKANVMARTHAGKFAFDYANPENRMLLLPLMRARGYVNQTLAATGQGGQQVGATSTVRPMTVQQGNVQIPAKPSYKPQASVISAEVDEAKHAEASAKTECLIQLEGVVSTVLNSAQQSDANASAKAKGLVQLARAVPAAVSLAEQSGAKAAVEHSVPQASGVPAEVNSVQQSDAKASAKPERSAQLVSAVPAAQPAAKMRVSSQASKQLSQSSLIEMKMLYHSYSYSELWESMAPEKRIKALTGMLQDQGYEKWDEVAGNSNVTDSRGDTPLLFIARNMSARIPIALLIDLLNIRQADMDFVNKQDGLTPLLASLLITGKRKKADEDLALMLLNSAADVNKACSTDGLTPLMLAASDDNLSELVKIFLEKGAVMSIPDRDGKTAIDYATPKNRELLERYLKPTP